MVIHLWIQLLDKDIRNMMKKGPRGATRLETFTTRIFLLGTIILFFELLKSSSPPLSCTANVNQHKLVTCRNSISGSSNSRV